MAHSIKCNECDKVFFSRASIVPLSVCPTCLAIPSQNPIKVHGWK